MTIDKTGATTTVTKEADRFTIAVDGSPPGMPSSPIATAGASSPTPRSTTHSRGAAWRRS